MHSSHDWRQASIEGGLAVCAACKIENTGEDQFYSCPEAGTH